MLMSVTPAMLPIARMDLDTRGRSARLRGAAFVASDRSVRSDARSPVRSVLGDYSVRLKRPGHLVEACTMYKYVETLCKQNNKLLTQ